MGYGDRVMVCRPQKASRVAYASSVAHKKFLRPLPRLGRQWQ